MGSGASSSYDASSQAALMGEMRASYETLAAQSSNLSDIELYSEMQAKYVEITTINNDGNLVNGVIKDKIPQLTDIAPTKHPSPILRMDSVAGEIVEKVEESSSIDAASEQFSDPSFVNQLLSDLPGVDMNDPQIQAAMAALGAGAASASDAQNKDKDKKEEK